MPESILPPPTNRQRKSLRVCTVLHLVCLCVCLCVSVCGCRCGCMHLCLCMCMCHCISLPVSLSVNLKHVGGCSCYAHIKLGLQVLIFHGPRVQHGWGQGVSSLAEVLLGGLVSWGQLSSVAVGLSAARCAHVQSQGDVRAPPVRYRFINHSRSHFRDRKSKLELIVVDNVSVSEGNST